MFEFVWFFLGFFFFQICLDSRKCTGENRRLWEGQINVDRTSSPGVLRSLDFEADVQKTFSGRRIAISDLIECRKLTHECSLFSEGSVNVQIRRLLDVHKTSTCTPLNVHWTLRSISKCSKQTFIRCPVDVILLSILIKHESCLSVCVSPPKVPGSWHFGSRPNLGQLKTWRSLIFKMFIFLIEGGGVPYGPV